MSRHKGLRGRDKCVTPGGTPKREAYGEGGPQILPTLIRITPEGVRKFQPRVASTLGNQRSKEIQRRRRSQTLIPDVTFIEFDSVRVQERTVFILKRHALVMLFLIFDVRNNVLDV